MNDSSKRQPEKPICIGVLAHVDAGKTTLSEQLLYRAGVTRAPGRVDHGNTLLDTDEIERTRGITVFSNQAWFCWQGRRFTLMDTPGHADFAAETERTLSVLDMAVLVIDGSAPIPAHTAALFRLLSREYRVPTVLFVNKTDLAGYDETRALSQISQRLTPDFVRVENGAPDFEQLALLHDDFLESYLAGAATPQAAWRALGQRPGACPLMTGAALAGLGVEALLDALAQWAAALPSACQPDAPLKAWVYQVRHAANGERVAFLKITQGTLRPRDMFHFDGGTEKVNQIRLYQGERFTAVDAALPGDAVGVTGLLTPKCGQQLSDGGLSGEQARFRLTPVLSARVEPPKGIAPAQLLEKLRVLEDEDPLLGVGWDAAHGVVTVQVMGTVQTEVLAQVLQNRFGLAAQFLPPLVLYKETIASPVVGCGHYEPLRHYAEAHLRLAPAPRGSGIAFQSQCHVDDLPLNYQNLIRTHVFERAHKGVLTGSPLTDVQITLLSGRAHLKHTEGGDFREAVYRAIRQGLMKAQSVLLEPFYRFFITVPADCLGRVMTDVAALHGACEPPEPLGAEARIAGRGPVSTFMAYAAQLRASTHGRGVIQLQPDGYDLCHNPDEVLRELAYNCGADTQNPAGSVFCSHGAGYAVPWDEADGLMHLPVEAP